MEKIKVDFLEKTIIILIKVLVFSTPLFFLPLNFRLFEFSREYLFFLLIPAILVLNVIKIIKEKKPITLKTSLLDLPIIVFLLVTFLAALFSIDRFYSFFGQLGNLSQAYLVIFSFILFYFFIINFQILKNDLFKIKIISLIKLLIYSYSITLVVIYLAIGGFWEKIIRAKIILASPFLNADGLSLEAFAVFSVVMISLIFGLLFFYKWDDKKAAWGKVYVKIILLFAILFLILVNSATAWSGLLFLGLILILFLWLTSNQPEERGLGIKKYFWPSLIIIFSCFFLFFNQLDIYKSLTGNNLADEAKPSFITSAEVTYSTLEDNLAIGSGPGTFNYDYSLYRDIGLNNSPDWQFRFNQASSFILDLFSTIGVLGILSYLLIIGLFIYLTIIYFRKYFYKNKENKITLVLLLAIYSLIFFQFSYLLTLPLLFLFWLMFGLIIKSWQEDGLPLIKERKISMKEKKIIFLLISFFIILIFSSYLILIGYLVKFAFAEYYARTNKIENLERAVNLNPYYANYQINLAKLYFNRVEIEMYKPISYRDNKYIEEQIDKSLGWARLAVNTRPNLVTTQETLGMIYRDIRYLTSGSELWAVRAFNEAVKLEPSNPVLATELGKAYLSANMLSEAKLSFKKALDLKFDYSEAKFNLARVFIKEKNETEAIKLLTELTSKYNDPEIHYELGRAYYNLGETENAINFFNKVLEIDPLHANALYSLGLAYELIGEDKEALIYFKKVLDMNPDNFDLQKKVEELGK
ncbi:MAG: tetratricopeptide repeat protein [Patescibacteria group bacterium]